MSGLSPSDFNFSTAGQQPIATSDSRLLDAAETLVTLQSRGGSRSRGTNEEKSRNVYLTPHQQSSYKMAPQPPTSSVQTPMGPPPPPSTANNVTFVLINQSQGNMMKPPIEPPPKRGRGRGRGRGASSGESGRGRGRGRGRGANRAQPVQVVEKNEQLDLDLISIPEDVEMGEVGEENAVVQEETFKVGDLEIKDSIFDDILNKKKLELIMDPEIMALLAKNQKSSRNGVKK